jgi:glycosyltransferase involved in cell wall biosynthesis
MSTARPIRLAALLSHPVQYFAPVFRELARRPEIDLTVIYCSLGGAHVHFDREFGLDVQWDTPLLDGYRYTLLRSWWPRKTSGPFAYLAPGIMHELRGATYDAVIVFGWAYLTCWLAFVKARLESIPWMLYGDTSVIYEREKRGLKRWLRNTLLHSLFERTSAFLVSGGSNRLFYESHDVPSRRCYDVPFVIDKHSFWQSAQHARRSRAEWRASHGIQAGAVLLLFSGKFIARKRPQDLLGALYALQAEFPQIGAVLVGDGELRPELQRFIDTRQLKNTVLLGFRNQSEIAPVYAAADILVVPSSLDPNPLVTNEAMACGLPLVVSDRTGVWGAENLVRPGENGFVYPCGDSGGLVAAIRKLICDSELRRRMGARSREISDERDLPGSVGRIVEAARFVVAGAAGRNCHVGSTERNEANAAC